jgi:hypothetical protein
MSRLKHKPDPLRPRWSVVTGEPSGEQIVHSWHAERKDAEKVAFALRQQGQFAVTKWQNNYDWQADEAQQP